MLCQLEQLPQKDMRESSLMWDTGGCYVMILQSRGLKLSSALIYLPSPSVVVFSLNSLSLFFSSQVLTLKKRPARTQTKHSLSVSLIWKRRAPLLSAQYQ